MQFNFRSRATNFDASVELYNRDKGTFFWDGNPQSYECYTAPSIKTKVSMRFMLNSHINPLITLSDNLESLVKDTYIVDFTKYSVKCEENPTKPGDIGPDLIGLKVEVE